MEEGANMRGHRRRRAAACLLALLALLATACGSGTSGAEGTASGTITMWARDSDASFVKQVVDSYNSSQDKIKVELTIVPANNFVQKFGASAATGSAPDVAAIDLIYIPYFASKGTLEDLSGRSRELAYMDKFSPSHMRLAKWEDRLYALPFSAEASVLYYNKDLFKRAGLDPDKPPRSWAEVASAARKIRALGRDVYGYYFSGACGGCNIFTIMPYIWAGGGEILESRGSEVQSTIASSPPVAEALTVFSDMWKAGVIPEAAKSDNGSNFNGPFQTGKVGMYGGGAFGIGTLEKDPKLDFGVTYLPGKTPGQWSSFAGGDEIAIPSRSKHKAAAWEFLKWVTSEKAQADLGKLGPVPVRTDVADDQYAKQGPKYAILAEAMTKGKTPYTTHFNSLINDNNGPWIGMLQRAIFDGDVPGAITQGQRQFQEILERRL
jgi:multiple sugar transport system substrate-binding protein